MMAKAAKPAKNVVLVVCCIDFRFEGDEVDAALTEIYGRGKKNLVFKQFVLPGAAIGLHPCNKASEAAATVAQHKKCCAFSDSTDLTHQLGFGPKFHKSLGSFPLWSNAFVDAVGHYRGTLKEVLFLNHQDCGVFKTITATSPGDSAADRLKEFKTHVQLVKDTVEYCEKVLKMSVEFRAHLLNLSGKAAHVKQLYPRLDEDGKPLPPVTGDDLAKHHEHEELHTAECIVVASMHFSSGVDFDNAMRDLGLAEQYDLVTLPEDFLDTVPTNPSFTKAVRARFFEYAIELLTLCARLHGPKRLAVVWGPTSSDAATIRAIQREIQKFHSKVQDRMWAHVSVSEGDSPEELLIKRRTTIPFVMTAEGYVLLTPLNILKGFNGRPIDLFGAVLQPSVVKGLTPGPGPDKLTTDKASDQGNNNAKRRRSESPADSA